MPIDQHTIADVGHCLTTGDHNDEEVYVHLHPTGLRIEIVEAAGGIDKPRSASARLRTQGQALELMAAIATLAMRLPASEPAVPATVGSALVPAGPGALSTPQGPVGPMEPPAPAPVPGPAPGSAVGAGPRLAAINDVGHPLAGHACAQG